MPTAMWAANDRLSLPQWLLCVTNPIWTLAILPKKNTFKGKGSFLSKFRLCTEIEMCLLFSCSDWLTQSPTCCSPKCHVILSILPRPTINTGPSLNKRNDPSVLHQAESSKHPFMSTYPSSKPRHQWCLIFCFSCTSLKMISMYTYLPGTWK